MADLGALMGVPHSVLKPDTTADNMMKPRSNLNKNRMHKTKNEQGKMRPEDKAKLECFYKPFNQALRTHPSIMKQHTITLIPSDLNQWEWLSQKDT